METRTHKTKRLSRANLAYAYQTLRDSPDGGISELAEWFEGDNAAVEAELAALKLELAALKLAGGYQTSVQCPDCDQVFTAWVTTETEHDLAAKADDEVLRLKEVDAALLRQGDKLGQCAIVFARAILRADEETTITFGDQPTPVSLVFRWFLESQSVSRELDEQEPAANLPADLFAVCEQVNNYLDDFDTSGWASGVECEWLDIRAAFKQALDAARTGQQPAAKASRVFTATSPSGWRRHIALGAIDALQEGGCGSKSLIVASLGADEGVWPMTDEEYAELEPAWRAYLESAGAR